ncbi:RHS repeat-associated core domain-containing protein [Eubacterium ruminantium]|nr:RHS repeat-associated core domain-containing protein [Eubacterium ruminantium]
MKSSYRYSAYGEILDITGVMSDGYYYTGEYYDSETGLYYLRARYMNPATATFTSMDSYTGNIYDPASLHRYLYCNANPVKYADPSGNSPILNQVVSMTISAILSTATTACIMGVIGGVVNAGFEIIRSGDVKKVVNAFIEGFKSGAKVGAYLGALTCLFAYCFSINIIKASAAVVLSHDSAKALSEFAIDRDYKKLAQQVPYILLDIVFFGAASIKTGNPLLPGYDGHRGEILDYNNAVKRTSKNSYGKSIENTEFFKENGGLDASDYISIHSRKHMYNPNTLSTPKKTQYGKDINVRKLCEDTIMNPDEVVYNIDQNVMIYKKKYPFNISTNETPTGTHRVFIPLNIQGKKTIRMSQFPLFEGD